MKEPKDYAKGEYKVGTHCFSFTDEGRKEVLGGAEGDRRITVRMYYPVTEESTAGKKRSRIFSPSKMKALRKSFLMPKLSPEENTADYYHVPPMSGEKFPLIMFSHGYGSYVEANTFLCCFLAARGYIVASVGHAFEAIENTYADGTFDLLDKTLTKKMYTSCFGALIAQTKLLKKKGLTREEAVREFDVFQRKYCPFMIGRLDEWVKDAEAAVCEVKKRYADYLDLSRGVGASGHSFGGDLAYYLCKYRDEFTCGINIDGALFGDYDDSLMETPFCQISCRENLNAETRPLIGTAAPAYLVTFDKMKHISFTDIKFMLNFPLFVGKISAEEVFENLSYCHLTFFDRYLKGKAADPEQTDSKNVHYEHICP